MGWSDVAVFVFVAAPSYGTFSLGSLSWPHKMWQLQLQRGRQGGIRHVPGFDLVCRVINTFYRRHCLTQLQSRVRMKSIESDRDRFMQRPCFQQSPLFLLLTVGLTVVLPTASLQAKPFFEDGFLGLTQQEVHDKLGIPHAIRSRKSALRVFSYYSPKD